MKGDLGTDPAAKPFFLADRPEGQRSVLLFGRRLASRKPSWLPAAAALTAVAQFFCVPVAFWTELQGKLHAMRHE